MSIPVVDCSGGIASKGSEIFSALRDVGFVYLTNSGVEEGLVGRVFGAVDAFWALGEEERSRWAKPPDSITGFVAEGRENFQSGDSPELREAFNFTPASGARLLPPPDLLPHFGPALRDYFQAALATGLQVLAALEPFLDIPAGFFESNHQEAEKSSTTLRLLRYAALGPSVAAGAVRCGEHSDYGTLTLLAQDDVGGLERRGLEVLGRDGVWREAVPVEGAVLVNTGDLLERWTSGRLRATRHRVLVKEGEVRSRSERRSVAFFLHPTDATEVRPLDGSDAFAPVNALRYLHQRYADTYAK